MPAKKKWSKRKRQKKSGYTLINKKVNPIPNAFITTVEYNDIFNCPAALASYYNVYRTNSIYAPFVTTNMNGVNNDSVYGWSNLNGMYGRYSVLSSQIKIECVNQSAVPIVVTICEQTNSGAITDQENILGNPNAKSLVIGNYTNVGKLSMTTIPYKRLGIDSKDDTYKALMGASPAVSRYYQISAQSMDNGATAVSCCFRLTMRFRVLLTDRTSLVQ